MKTTTNNPASVAEDILRRLLSEITLHSKYLKIEDSPLGRSHTIKIQVHRGDMARVIGTGGLHAQAIESLVGMIGRRHGVAIKSRFVEPEVGEKDKYPKFEAKDSWDSTNTLKIIQDIAEAIFEHDAKVEVFDGADYESVVEVVVSSRENKELVEMVGKVLKPLFNAVGKGNGRLLTVNVAPGEIF